MPVRLDHHGHEVRIVEGGCGAIVGRVVEPPVRRPEPPQKLAELPAIRLEASPSALAVKVVLVPEAMLLIGRVRLSRGADALDVVATAGHETGRPLRPESSHHAGRAAAPIVA